MANPTPKPVEWNGQTYPSISALARAQGVSTTTVRRWVRRGYTCDADVTPNTRPVAWNGVAYPSITSAARAVFVTDATMGWRLKQNYTRDADLRW